MGSNWSLAELKILQVNLDVVTDLETLEQLLPDRSCHGILRQAQNLGFGVKTKDGVKTFVRGKGKRVISATVDEIEVATNNLTSTMQPECFENKSDCIIAKISLKSQTKTDDESDVLKANAEAMKTIHDNELPVDINLIHYLSKRILLSNSDVI